MTTYQRRVSGFGFALLAMLATLNGCGGSGGGGGGGAVAPTATQPAATATSVAPTSTPTTAPTQTTSAAVSGLVVLRNGVPGGAEDALGAPPSEWMQTPDAQGFDTALSHADWVLEGPQGRTGTTGADGSFEIRDLPPGNYTLTITKTLNGNLAAVTVPIVVGDDGEADIVVEIDRGNARSISTYPLEGETFREVWGPAEARVVTRDGKVTEFGGPGTNYSDPDGDGMFDPTSCPTTLSLCQEGGQCTAGSCRCTASCPACDDCGPGVCSPFASTNPYRCEPEGGCRQPGDQCVCVSSCDDCTDCVMHVCVPACSSFEIEALSVTLSPSTLRIGGEGSARAYAELSNGLTLDVTYSATWSSSDESVATVDNWARVVAGAIGTTQITASFGGITSSPAELRVVERPALRRIQVEIGPCAYPVGIPEVMDPSVPPRATDEFFPDPYCRQVVRVGATIPLIAFGEFENGEFQEITREVDWNVSPASVGEIDDGGVFTANAEGTASITAALGGVTSDAREIRVVTEPTLVQLTIYPTYGAQPPVFFPVFDDDPKPAGDALPCFECGYPVTILKGDELQFVATARYDTGEWEDVTTRVTWRSSAGAVATIDANGLLAAIDGGQSTVDAVLDEVTSNPVNLTVVNEATLQYLYIYQEGADRVVGKGGQAFFRATANYDVGFSRDVTDSVTWRSSDDSIGGFDEPGVFTGRTAGNVQVWAQLDNKQTERLPMEVFETSDITYCDAANVNRGIWSDAFNRVVLESDCAQYQPPAVVNLRFTVTERERPGGIFDPCLDLFVYQDGRKIRTIRNEGCGEPFLAPGAADYDSEAPRFQLKAFWDLKDDRGNLVAPGQYTIYGRFYLYFDPVVSIDVAVTAPNGRIPCTDNPCGNGCGYVHACGDSGPSPCPSICTEICECPSGWGITSEGDCEPCPLECCPAGAPCLPEIPPCEPEICGGIAGLGCPEGQTCDLQDPTCATDVAGTCVDKIDACPEFYQPVCSCEGETYPNDCFRIQAGATLAYQGICGDRCCPPNADCIDPLPPCPPQPCCPAGQACIPELPPCDLRCCPIGALCGPLDLPMCAPGDCCPLDPAVTCPDILPACSS